MRSDIYWIAMPAPGRLAITARPRSGDWLQGEITAWASQGVDTVVCLLERYEVIELGLEDEEPLCLTAGLDFISFPIADRETPDSVNAATVLVDDINARLHGNNSVLVHCRAGIGRSAVIAACALTALGLAADAAFEKIAAARGVGVPDTDEQKLWVEEFLAAFRAKKRV